MICYKHKNESSRLTIKKEFDHIVICELIDEPMVYNIFGYLKYKTIIVKKENLEII